jgi:hypothetical protein
MRSGNSNRLKNLGLVRAELPMTVGKALKANRELDVTAADDVLDLEFG